VTLATPLSVSVALFYDAAWNDITSYVMGRHEDRIRITRGLRDRQSSRVAQPAQCVMTLRNTDGRFSLRNPTSPLYGKIGRNTKIRVQVTTAAGLSTRFVGEVAEWPLDPVDASQSLITTPLVASGVLRRLQKRSDIGDSPMARHYRSASNRLGYWSLEDGPLTDPVSGSSFGSPVRGCGRLTVTGGVMGPRSDAFVGSDPVPELSTAKLRGATTRSTWSSTTGNAWTLIAHLAFPDSLAATVSAVHLGTNGSGHDFYLRVNADCTVSLTIGDQDGVVLDTAGPSTTSFANQVVRFRIATEMSGSDFTWAWSYLLQGQTAGTSLASGTVTGETNGRPQMVTLNFDAQDCGSLVVSHVAVFNGLTLVTSGADDFAGYAGETVANRIERLAGEAGTAAVTDPLTGTVLLGPQPRAAFVDLLRDATACDGVVFDQRTDTELSFQGFESRVNPTEVTIPFSDLTPPVRPIEDDVIANDVTVTRAGGASARVEITDGPLGVTAVGRYSEGVTLNVHRDSDVPQQAAWRANLGTTDDLRLPEVTVNLIAAETATSTAVTNGSIDIGTRLLVSGIPNWLGRGSLRQIVEGYTEVISRYDWTLTLQTSPASPYDWLVLDDTTLGRLSPDGATLSAAIATTGATSMSVATPAGKPLWVTGSVSIPVLVSGTEAMTVTNISGASSPQTFTMARGLNGYTSTHLSGATVELFHPRRLGL
jgi:hypothetical protein